MHRIAVVRIRGKSGLNRKITDTLQMLRLYKQNYCVIIPDNPAFIGMLKKVKDVVTWGEIDEETCQALLEKRGKITGKMLLSNEYLKEKNKIDILGFTKEFMEGKKELKDIPGLKPYFRLNPPQKGFGNGIKIPYSLGGALGYRKDKINELIKRML